MQLDQEEKGFSFRQNGPLDMRMDPNDPFTAADIVNEWTEEQLGEIFRELGEEPRWRKAAKLIVEARQTQRFETTLQLSDLIAQTLGRGHKKKLHPATLIFQALRICVNRELEAIQEALPKAIEFLPVGGRIGVITFHSLEDRIVKGVFKEESAVKAQNKYKAPIEKPLLRLINKKPIVADLAEVKRNPRSRSAKIRFAEKLK